MRAFLFNNIASLTAQEPLTVLETDSSAGIFLSVLRNCQENVFCRTLLINHFSHEFFFSLLQISELLQPKTNLFGGAMVKQEKEFTSPFDPVQLWKSGGNFIVKLWPNMYRPRHSNIWRSGRKGRTEEIVKVG